MTSRVTELNRIEVRRELDECTKILCASIVARLFGAGTDHSTLEAIVTTVTTVLTPPQLVTRPHNSSETVERSSYSLSPEG